jgi:serine protease inhibitor
MVTEPTLILSLTHGIHFFECAILVRKLTSMMKLTFIQTYSNTPKQRHEKPGLLLSNVSICSAHGHLIKHAGANDTGSKQPQTTMVFATSQPMLQARSNSCWDGDDLVALRLTNLALTRQ